MERVTPEPLNHGGGHTRWWRWSLQQLTTRTATHTNNQSSVRLLIRHALFVNILRWMPLKSDNINDSNDYNNYTNKAATHTNNQSPVRLLIGHALFVDTQLSQVARGRCCHWGGGRAWRSAWLHFNDHISARKKQMFLSWISVYILLEDAMSKEVWTLRLATYS